MGLDCQAPARQVRRRLKRRWHAPPVRACLAASQAWACSQDGQRGEEPLEQLAQAGDAGRERLRDCLPRNQARQAPGVRGAASGAHAVRAQRHAPCRHGARWPAPPANAPVGTAQLRLSGFEELAPGLTEPVLLARQGSGSGGEAGRAARHAQDPAPYACLPPAASLRQSLGSAGACATTLPPMSCLGALSGELGAGLHGGCGAPPWARASSGHFSGGSSLASHAGSGAAACSAALPDLPPLQDWSTAGALRGAGLPPSPRLLDAAAAHDQAAAVPVRGQPDRGRSGSLCLPTRGSAPGDLGWCEAPPPAVPAPALASSWPAAVLPAAHPRAGASASRELAWAGVGPRRFPYSLNDEAALAALLAAGSASAASPPYPVIDPFGTLLLQRAAVPGSFASPFDAPGLGAAVTGARDACSPSVRAGGLCDGQQGSSGGARGGGPPGGWPPLRSTAGPRPRPVTGGPGGNESDDAAVLRWPDAQIAHSSCERWVCGREAESAHGSVTRSGFCRLARCRSGALCTLMAAQRCRELACIGAQVRRWRRRQRLAAGPAAHVPGARAGAAAADRRLQRDWRLRPRRARAAAGGLPRAHHAPGAARPAPARAALRAAGRAPGGAGCARVCLEGAL